MKAVQSLNEPQQRAVDHGTGADAPMPLLVIAGAGSGKTSTLAHRIAHLVRAGADPQRLLLLTFSRRAAMELERRAGQVLQATFKGRSDRPPSLPWSGTFHSVGRKTPARVRASVSAWPPNFTIHDRGDSEDLMALVRTTHIAAEATNESRFPGAATCVAIYSRVVNSESPLGRRPARPYPWCARSRRRGCVDCSTPT